MKGVCKPDIARGDILDRFEYAFILADAANGDAEAIVEVTIGDLDVSAVGLGGDGVVTIDDGPSVEADVV